MSSGVSPWAYPVDRLTLGVDVWQSLPPPNTALIEAASQYYQAPSDHCIAAPGSQIIIRLLPQCLAKTTVAVPAIGYQEHAWSWRLAGHEVCYYDSLTELFSLVERRAVEHAVLINPNNPSGELASVDFIKHLLVGITGTLVVDEAFIDPFLFTKHSSVASAVTLNSDKLIVLRSVGKFFGLAGIRVGFAFGTHSLLAHLNTLLQPWLLSYASQVIAEQALRDTQWQHEQNQRIVEADQQFRPVLSALCKDLGSCNIKHRFLFHTVFADQDELVNLHESLAKKGVWTRLFNQGDNPAWLRFSLPSDANELKRRLEKV